MINLLKKIILLLILFVIFIPISVKADRGDLRYEVTDVEIIDSYITFKGWAFIHKTNNYVSVIDKNGKVHNDGGQRIYIRALNGNQVIETLSVKGGSDKFDYNFYCELFYKSADGVSYVCEKRRYLDFNYNSCRGNDSVYSQCYYEDVYFEITFNTSDWNVRDDETVTFEIAASNNHFKSIYNKKHTDYEPLSISDAAIVKENNDYILIEGNKEDKINYIASYGLLKNIENDYGFKYNGKCSYGVWSTYGNNTYELNTNLNGYPDGRSPKRNLSKCDSDFLGKNCLGSYMYAIKVQKEPGRYIGGCYLALPCSGDNCTTAIAYGSHVKPTGNFKINVFNDKKCDVTNPLPNKLECNNSGTLKSTCDELTVKTDKGRAEVKIEQVGTVTSVMTPDSIYAGGGFKFGIIYYNTIKWDYSNNKKPKKELHDLVVAEMNKKIKDYNSYVAGINIKDLKFGDSIINSGMVKKCYTSSDNKNYYKNGITVSCVFTFPSSSIELDGKVKYDNVSSSSLNINNKYYTPIEGDGNYKISVTITGMDRITENSSKEDSADKNNKPWTGNWEDSIDGCEINLYPLLKTANKSANDILNVNFIYRPIDIKNPFPERNPGINWFDWYNISKNKERLENTYDYDNLQYKAILDNETISDIKKYNRDNSYLDWNSIDDNTGKSSFITDYDYIVRVGGN